MYDDDRFGKMIVYYTVVAMKRDHARVENDKSLVRSQLQKLERDSIHHQGFLSVNVNY